MNGHTTENLSFVVVGILSGEGGHQYPEWIIDILSLANDGYAKEKRPVYG